jgi:aryl-alcohol dehydrogenase-like predicted oxidoreductase
MRAERRKMTTPNSATISSDQATPGTLRIGDLSVGRLGFGAMRITGRGVWGPPADRAAAVRLLRRAVELGVTFIDTADSYGPGVSEELIAEALAPYRDGLVIATKGGLTRPGPGEWRRDGRPAHLRAACEASLKRLRTDRIDLYQLEAWLVWCNLNSEADAIEAALLRALQVAGRDPVDQKISRTANDNPTHCFYSPIQVRSATR